MATSYPSSPDQNVAPPNEPTGPTPASSSAPTSTHVARRTLLLSAAIAAGAVATPFALEKGTELAADEIRALLRHEIGSLEGIALDEAIAIAELTRKAVELIVIPLADFMATVSGDGLLVLADTITRAEQVLEFAHLPTDGLPALAALLGTWRTNEAQLPVSLQSYANTNITGAETYLRGVKAKVDGSAAV